MRWAQLLLAASRICGAFAALRGALLPEARTTATAARGSQRRRNPFGEGLLLLCLGSLRSAPSGAEAGRTQTLPAEARPLLNLCEARVVTEAERTRWRIALLLAVGFVALLGTSTFPRPPKSQGRDLHPGHHVLDSPTKRSAGHSLLDRHVRGASETVNEAITKAGCGSEEMEWMNAAPANPRSRLRSEAVGGSLAAALACVRTQNSGNQRWQQKWKKEM